MDLEKDILELDIGLLVKESIMEALDGEELDEFVTEYLEQLTQEQIESIKVYELIGKEGEWVMKIKKY